MAGVQKPYRKRPPAKTAEAREKQLEAMAYDVAEKQLRDGTASNQVIVHFLRSASIKARKELVLLEHEVELKKAKTESIKSAERMENIYKEAMNAFRSYSGAERVEEDDD